MRKTEIAIIGAGSAGYVAAIRASQLGAETVLVEKNTVGGTCLNRGCIPTKSLLSSVEVLNLVRRAQEFGLEVDKVKPDLSSMVRRKNRIVDQLRRGVHYLLRANKVNLIQGRAQFLAPHRIKVDTPGGAEEIEARKVIIATGSRPLIPSFIDASHPQVLTSEEALKLDKAPQSLLIVGAGVIGCELGTIFSSLGSRITMVEMMDQILPTEDKRVSRQLERVFQKRGIKVLTGTKLEKITEYRQDGLLARLENGEELEVDKVLICIGRVPDAQELGLERLDLEVDEKGNIKVNERMETSVEGIYAAGDVIGEPLLAHVASREGIVATENALGINSRMDYRVVPHCIFTSPQIGTVGLSPDEAEEKGIKVKIGRFSFSANGKAQAMGETTGFVQIVAEGKKILGAQIIGPQATELIHEMALAIKWGIDVEKLDQTIHAHPTLSEAIAEAALSAQGKSIHLI